MAQPDPIEAIAAGLRNLSDQVSLIVNVPNNGAALADRVSTLEQRSNASDHVIQNHSIMLEQLQSNHLALMARFEKLDQKIDTFHWNLTQTIENLDKKIDTVNRNLGQKIENLDKKIDTVNRNLGQKIDTVHRNLDQKIDNIHRNLDQKIDTVHQNLDQKIDTVDAHVDKIQRDLSALNTFRLYNSSVSSRHPLRYPPGLVIRPPLPSTSHELHTLTIPQCIETAAILNLPTLPPNTPVATRRRAIAQYLGVLVEY